MELNGEKTEEIDQLISQAEDLIERRKPEALPLAKQIMTIAQQKGNPKYYAQAKYVMAFYHCLIGNDYAQAIQLCEEVLTTFDEEELAGVQFKIYMTLGNANQLKGDVFAAELAYMKGLKSLENKVELSRREKGALASFYYNLSLLLNSSQLGITAEEYLEKAIAIYEELESFFKLSKGYVAYASVLGKKKEYAKAIEVLHKALEIDEKLNDPYSIALTKANLGILHLRTNKTEIAFDYIDAALQYYISNNMLYETAMVKTTLGEALDAIGKTDEAIKTLLEAEKLFGELNNRQEATRIFEILAGYFKKRGDFEKALHYHTKYTEGLKFFFDVEKTNALTRAKKEFESEQKEKEALLQMQKNEEIKKYVTRLEHSNDQLKQFAGVASHDLREPLRMISSYTGLLQKTLNGHTTTQQNEFMNFIVNGAKRMDQLIYDLLRLAKVDANPQLVEVNLNTVVEEIKMNMGVLLEEKNALVIYPELPRITADRTMLLQLFQNIIGNGIKYNESSTPTIKIKCRKLAGTFEISIADNGIGIPETLREKAFQIFHRLPTKKEYSGTGIGLAICKKIVDSMDGSLTIDNNPGGGTVFIISLPASLICEVKEFKDSKAS